MSKLKLLSIAVVSLFFVNLTTVGFLFLRKPPQGPFGQMSPRNRIIEILHFEKEQVEQYEKLIKQHRTSVHLLDERIREAKSNLYQTLNENDSIVKDSLVNELGALQKKIENVHYTHFEEIKQLCKPHQQAYFNKLTGNLVEFFSTEKQPLTPPKE